MSSLLFRFPFTPLLRLQLVGPGGNLALMGGRRPLVGRKVAKIGCASRAGRVIGGGKSSTANLHQPVTFSGPMKFHTSFGTLIT